MGADEQIGLWDIEDFVVLVWRYEEQRAGRGA